MTSKINTLLVHFFIGNDGETAVIKPVPYQIEDSTVYVTLPHIENANDAKCDFEETFYRLAKSYRFDFIYQ